MKMVEPGCLCAERFFTPMSRVSLPDVATVALRRSFRGSSSRASPELRTSRKLSVLEIILGGELANSADVGLMPMLFGDISGVPGEVADEIENSGDGQLVKPGESPSACLDRFACRAGDRKKRSSSLHTQPGRSVENAIATVFF